MPVYEYKALNEKGKTVSGIIDTESALNARQKLRASNIFPISIKEVYAEDVSTEQALTEIMAWLSEQDEVEDTRAFSTTDLTVRFRDGSQIGILLGRRQAYGPLIGPQEVKGGSLSKPDCDE